MPKLLPISENDTIVAYSFDCPGCGMSHEPYVRPHKSPDGASWDFNGDIDRPTFMPSILSRFERTGVSRVEICHSYVTDGKIRYLADCSHALAGKEVEIPDQG